MSVSLQNPRLNEYDLNFDDPRGHAVLRWKEMIQAYGDSLSPSDRQVVYQTREWSDLARDIQEVFPNQCESSLMRRLLMQLQPLPRSLANLTGLFTQALLPKTLDQSILWGLIYLNIKLSMLTQERLARTTEWLVKLRRTVERFTRCYILCEEKNEAVLATIDIFDHTLAVLCDSVKFLRRGSTEVLQWQLLRDHIAMRQVELDETTKHLSEITSYSKASMQTQIQNLSARHALVAEPEEPGLFPICMVPFSRNSDFYGRQKELDKIDKSINWEGSPSLRTFTIYGRRGVGKTEIALEYCHRNPSRFDAIFWIGCETALTLRQSFTNIAIKLGLPGAEKNGHHEENLLMVQNWLKKTSKQWLMIFDNAERDSEYFLKGYWPIGAMGSILITSRDYYNFMKDQNRRGDTILPLSTDESWGLLLQLLGKQWLGANDRGLIKKSEIVAAKSWMEQLGGLPLSVRLAATMISNPSKITGLTIAETYEKFKTQRANLPQRYRVERSLLIRNLDSLSDMSFTSLSSRARDLLAILALMSPDEILIELFLPRNQSALDGKLAFCQQPSPQFSDGGNQATLASIINLSPALSKTLEELQAAKLIKRENRVISIHRVVQEAMNYHSKQDLQESFNSAVNLVYEAFPKQWYGNTLYDKWPLCESYITHAVHLSRKFAEFQAPDSDTKIEGGEKFFGLLGNATWYLHEIGDYSTGMKVIDIAKSACRDKESWIYSYLCNTQGGNYFELNRTVECRAEWELALSIREKLKNQPDYGDLAISYHNLASLEVATGHIDEAMKYYQKSVDIRIAIGDAAAFQLANSYLGIGRCYAQQRSFQEARRKYAQAEQLFIRTIGSNQSFMGHCHYAYGNIDYREGHYLSARISYEATLAIATAETPIHPLTIATYYSLGAVEFKLGNLDKAKGFLTKARNLAELRSPARDDGTVARILWKLAQVLKNDVSGGGTEEANALLNRAYMARASLISTGEAGEGIGAEVIALSEDEAQTEQELDEESFNQLVPFYFK